MASRSGCSVRLRVGAGNQVVGSSTGSAAARQAGKPPLNVGRAGEPELLQRGGGQAGLVALVAQQDDVIVEVWGIGVAVLACRVQPPFQDVAGGSRALRR